MSKMFTRFLAVAALLCMASATFAASRFPNPTCPDSVTIFQVKNGGACKPAVADTVSGVGGIIVGFDPIPTGFDAYIETSGGGPYQGIDFFTHSVNTKSAPYNFALGDSIVVEFAKVDLFAGDLEIDAPNGSFGSPNFVVRKVSSGNTLPPFFFGTVGQLFELPTNTFFPQYVGSLIHLDQTSGSSLKVARTSLTGGLGQNNAFLLVDSTAPSDSVFVDGNKLTTFAPPPVGTPVTSVQGVGNAATRGFRIMLRDGNDIVLNTPPNLTDAWPLTDNTILLSFDRNITTASGQNTANYSLASFGSVTNAVMSGQSQVVLTINNGLSHGDLETVTANGIVGLAAGQTMTTPQSRTFVNGVVTAAEIQQANPDSLNNGPTCVDRSRFAGAGGQVSQGAVGPRITMAAISSARYGSIYYQMDAGNPNRGGVAAFAPPAVLTIGHTWRLVGQVQEFFGETEFSNIISVTDQGPATVPTPKLVSVIQAARDTCDYTNTVIDGEDFEGRLVTLGDVKVVQRFPTLPTNGFHVADQSYPDTIFVQDFNGVLDPLVSPPLGDVVNLTGVVHYEGGSFRIVPRNYGDIVDLGTAGVGPTKIGSLSFSVAPNPARHALFSFSLPQAADVNIGIYDVAGRQVMSLVNGKLPSGNYQKSWSGETSDGRTASAGVYFARMKANGVEYSSIRTVFLGR
jgi:hypothetical protein